MTDTSSVPTIGAAMLIDQLDGLADWLVTDQRDLEIQDAYVPETLDGDWRPLVRRTRDTLAGYTGRLGVHGPFDGIVTLSRDTKVRALACDRLRQGLEFAAALGATHMVMHSPFQYFGSPFFPHPPFVPREALFAIAHETLGPIVELARQAGCMLVMENIFDTNPAPLMELVRSFHSDFLRASLDTGHAFITQRIGGATPDRWVYDAGELLQHVHIQDTDGHSDRHWAAGDGNINWYALFEALGTLRHRPRLLIEVRNFTDIRRSADYLSRRGFAC